jgi:hypothetical protein
MGYLPHLVTNGETPPRPEETEREGCAPGVIYTSGTRLHGAAHHPNAMSDSVTSFATMSLDELLAAVG